MVNKKWTLRTYILLLILAILILSVAGCVENNKDDINQNNSSLTSTSENVQGDIERLKHQRDEIMKRIEQAKATKPNTPILATKETKEAMKRLQEQDKRLLEQSKEIDEKIKELQKSRQ